MRFGRSFLVSLRGLLALVGLAIGFALPNPFLLRILKTSAARTLLLAMVTFATLLFSGCANGDFTSISGQQQKTPVNTHARDQGGVPSSWVDFSKDPNNQTGDTYPRGHKGLGTP